MRGLLLLFFVTGIVSAVGMPSPHVSYHTKSGGLIEASVTDISADMFRSMSPTSLDMSCPRKIGPRIRSKKRDRMSKKHQV